MANIFSKLFSGRDGRLAAAAQQAALREGETKAIGAIDSALTGGQDYLTSAADLYQPFTGGGTAAYGLYNDSLGLNGADGRQRALAAFQTGPGYQFALGQGEQGILRNGAARGMLGSGNISADLMKFNQGLANQEYGNWQAGLGKSSALGLTGAAGQAGIGQSLANLGMQGGLGKAGIYTNTAQGIGNAAVQGQMAGQNASANAWGAAMGVGNLLSSFFGGKSGSGSVGGGSSPFSTIASWVKGS